MNEPPLAGQAAFEVRVHTNLDLLPRGWWQGLQPPSVYLSYDWLRARSSMVRGLPRFVTVSGLDGRPILAVPAYLTDENAHPGYDAARLLHMEDFDDAALSSDPEAAAPLARLHTRLSSWPSLARPGIVAGAPGLMGGVAYAPGLSPATKRAALHTAATAMDRQASADCATATCWLYVLEGTDEILDECLHAGGYDRIVMGADCYLPIRWPSLDAYVASLPASRRRKVRREISATAEAGVEIEACGAEAFGPELAALELQWRHKYGRSAALDATLAGYDELRAHVGDKIILFVARLAGRAVGFTCFLDDSDVWWARFGGFDYSAGPLFLYFNLTFYHPIRDAIARGVGTIAYSRSAYETKRSRGCLLRKLSAYIKVRGVDDLMPDLRAISAAQERRFNRISALP